MRDSVLVCIPTFKRPKMLRRLLDALAVLDSDADVRVLIADNDAENHAGFDFCQRLTDYRWPLSAVIAPERGIAQVRNILIEQALKTDARFIAMIDDDEWPHKDWIAQFLKCAHETDADLLQGSILFGGGDGLEGHGDIRHTTGPVTMLQGAGNLLIRRTVLEEMTAPWFDPAFALSGGEDREFFVRLQRAGKRFAWSDEARAHGDIPETKNSLGWLLRRAYSVGNSDMRVLLKHGLGTSGVTIELCKIAAALFLSPLAALALAVHPRKRTIPLQKLFRAAGKLGALMGLRYNEYAVVHGE
jgi:glycosyltransferase involved in cell wall biosynthesis